MDVDDDDPVVSEFDVFLANDKQQDVCVMQYVLRPRSRPYSIPFGHTYARVKPRFGKVEITMDAKSVDEPVKRFSGEYLQSLKSGVGYAVGYRSGEGMHMIPLSGIAQVRPNIAPRDDGMSRGLNAVRTVSESSAVGRMDSKSGVVQVHVMRRESEWEAAAYLRSYACKQQQESSEEWTDCGMLQNRETEMGQALFGRLFESCEKSEEDSICGMTDRWPTLERSLGMGDSLPVTNENESLEKVKEYFKNISVTSLSRVKNVIRFTGDIKYLAKRLAGISVIVGGFFVKKTELSKSLPRRRALAREFALSKFAFGQSVTLSDVIDYLRIQLGAFEHLMSELHCKYSREKKEWNFGRSIEAETEILYAVDEGLIEKSLQFWKRRLEEIDKEVSGGAEGSCPFASREMDSDVADREEAQMRNSMVRATSFIARGALRVVDGTAKESSGNQSTGNDVFTELAVADGPVHPALKRFLSDLFKQHGVCSVAFIKQSIELQKLHAGPSSPQSLSQVTDAEIGGTIRAICKPYTDSSTFVLASTGDSRVDEFRDVIMRLLCERGRARKAEVKRVVQELVGKDIPQAIYTRILKELADRQGVIWVPKDGSCRL